MKKISKIIIVSLILVIVFSTEAKAQATPGLLFTLINNGREYSVSKGTTAATAVVIPSVYNGKPVTAVSENGFKNYKQLTNITIPDSVKVIGYGALGGCSDLTSITTPFIGADLNGTKNNYLGYLFGLDTALYPENTYMFYQAAVVPPSLKTIVITGGNSIGSYAFSFCSNLTSVTMPNSLKAIGESAFIECRGLTSITIPNSVTVIGDGAFAYCSSITSITIPNGVTAVGKATFRECTSLTSIVIPNKVKSIGENAFEKCSSLTSVVLGSSVTTIGELAFYACKNLTTIVIPRSIKTIVSLAFYECTSLRVFYEGSAADWNRSVNSGLNNTPLANRYYYSAKEPVNTGSYWYYDRNNLPAVWGADVPVSQLMFVLINNGKEYSVSGGTVTGTALIIPSEYNGKPVTEIGHEGFYGWTQLTGVTIPASVKIIRMSAFEECSGLTNITIGSGVTNIEGSAFRNCSSLTSITIPTGVTLIGSVAFGGCSGLTNIVIPASVTTVGYAAFSSCTGLKSIVIPAGVTIINEGVFHNCTGLIKVYYGGNASAWSRVSVNSLNNAPLINAARYYYSITAPTATGNYWYFDNNGVPAIWGG